MAKPRDSSSSDKCCFALMSSMVKLALGDASAEKKMMDKIAKALPSHPPGLNTADLSDAEARREMLLSVIKDCIVEPGHILSIHSALAKRKKVAISSEESHFLLPADMKSVTKIPSEHLVKLVSALGDVSRDDVIQVKEYDSCSDSQMFTFATALSPAIKLSEDCRVPSVLTGLVCKRSSDMGNRLATFKATGGIVMGKINWKKGVYSPTYNPDTQVLSGLTHISGDFVVAPSWTGQITNRWPIQQNWCDWTAHFECPPSPPVPCRLLFRESKTGPWNLDLVRTPAQHKTLMEWVHVKHID